MDETRVECYLDGPKAAYNKAAFEAPAADPAAVETSFRAKLLWQRLDEKRTSRASFTVPGGWAAEARRRREGHRRHASTVQRIGQQCVGAG